MSASQLQLHSFQCIISIILVLLQAQCINEQMGHVKDLAVFFFLVRHLTLR